MHDLPALIANFSLTPLLGISGFSYALELPLWPTKVILWGLFAISLLTWTIILSKGVSLFRGRKSDQNFLETLNAGKGPLDFFTEVRQNWDEFSLRSYIYRGGAREICYQMMGSAEVDETIGARVERCDPLNESQFAHVRAAIHSGERAAGLRLRAGFTILAIGGVVAPMLGLIGCAWLMKTGYESLAKAGEQVLQADVSASAWAVLLIALTVGVPAITARIVFGHLIHRRLQGLHEFSNELLKAFDRHHLEGGAETRPSMPLRRAIDKKPHTENESEPITAATTPPIQSAPEPDSTPRDETPEFDEVLEREALDADEIPTEKRAQMEVEETEAETEPTFIESPFELVEEDAEESSNAALAGNPHHQPVLGFEDFESDEDIDPSLEFLAKNTASDDFEIEPEMNPIARQTLGV